MLAAVLIYSGFSVYFCYSTLAPFFPSQLQKRGFNRLCNSVVFAIFALSFVAGGLLSKRYFIPKCGRVRTFIVAALLQLIAILLLGLLPLIPNNSLLLTTGIIARFIQGGGASVQILIGFAILSLAYKERIELLHNLFQIGITLGLATSPFSGSFVFQLLGYKGPFLVAAIVSLPPLLLPCAMKNRQFPNDQVQSGSTISVIFKNKRAMLTYLYFGMTSFLISTLETCLANRLSDVFNFEPNSAAIYFAIFFSGAVTTSILCAFLSRESDKSVIILISLFVCSFSFLLIGPSSILHIPIYKGIVAVGLFLAGAYNPIANYAVSQALKFTQSSVPEDEYGDLVNAASALRPFASGIGLFFGPIVGGLLTQFLGFAHMSEIYFLLFLICAFIEMAVIIHHRRSPSNSQINQRNLEEPETKKLISLQGEDDPENLV